MVQELRARGIGEILDVAVALYRSRFGKLIGLAAIVIVPVQVLSTAVLLSARPDSYTPGLSGNATPQFSTNSAVVELAALVVVLFVGFVSNAFVVGLCARPVGDAYVDAPSPGPATPKRSSPVRCCSRRAIAAT